MKIICDENMPVVAPLFSGFGEVVACSGRSLSADMLADADVLLVRSVTSVTSELLAKATQLKMLGTATIGMDHIDQAYLQQRGIPFFSAPGCNATAVVEYVLSSLYQVLHKQERSLQDLTVGIIGVGHVGSILAKRLKALGVELLLNDPPKAEHDPEPYVPLDTLLNQADVICCHTPLTCEGNSPSYHLLNQDNIGLLKSDAVLLNAGRGAVIDNQALKAHLASPDNELQVVLDVWEDEPIVDAELAVMVTIATPHIAGYSLEGKVRGTFMLYQAFCRLFGYAESHRFEDMLPQAKLAEKAVSADVSPVELIRCIYDPFQDDRALRDTLYSANQPLEFDSLRKNYPVRREFSSLKLIGDLSTYQRDVYSSLGFDCS